MHGKNLIVGLLGILVACGLAVLLVEVLFRSPHGSLVPSEGRAASVPGAPGSPLDLLDPEVFHLPITSPPDPREASIPGASAPWTTAELEALWNTVMPLDEVRRLAQLHVFAISEKFRESFQARNASMLETLGREGLAWKLGRKIDANMFLELAAVEAPFNADIRALSDAYLNRFDSALREAYATGQYTVEDRKPDGSFRLAKQGESRTVFPGRAVFYDLYGEQFKHLEEPYAKVQDAVSRRYAALFEYIDANR